MDSKRLTYRPIRWILLGVAFLLLLGGGLFWAGKIGDQLRTWITPVSPSSPQQIKDTAEVEMKTVPSGSGIGAGQGPAKVSPMHQQLMGVQTAVVEKHRLSTTVRAVGKVTYNEQRITHVNLRISGWIEDLLVDYTGQPVQKGQPLFTLYSPELVATQDEYLLALRALEDVQQSPVREVREQAQQMMDAARDRLRLWTFTDDQIDKLKRQRIPKTSVTIFSPMSGHVIDKTAFQGMFVQPKMTMYTIADLSTVWVQAEVYEYEVPFIKKGQAAVLTLEAFPGEQFSGRVTYVYPYLNKESRTVKVRLEFSNPDFRLKPGMYGTMLVQVDRGSRLAVPDQAVLDSGVRQVVFVAKGQGVFEPRDVTLGPKVGSYFEVIKGLKEGEQIVTSGTFLLDSESKLMASSNMMGALGMGGIKMEQAQMGEMDMGGMDQGMNPKMQGSEMAATQKGSAGKIEKTADGLTLVFFTNPTPARIGENWVHVTVTDQSGKLVTNAEVHVTLTMPMPGMTPASVTMTPGKQGIYGTKVNLGMAGQWELTVTIRRSNQPEVNVSFLVVARGGGMSGMPGM